MVASVITGVIIAVVIVIVLVLLGILYRYCRSPEKHAAPVKYKKHKKSHGYTRSGFGSGSYYPPGGWSSDIGHSSSDEEAGRGADSGHESFGHDSGGHDSGGHGSGGHDSGCHDSGGGCDSGGGRGGEGVEEGVTVVDVTE